MKMVWHIASNDLRLFLSDKGGYVWLFVMPVVFIYLFGNAYRGSNGLPSNPRPSVYIENQDEGFMGVLFCEQLQQQGFEFDEQELDSQPVRSLRIPRNFTKSIAAGEHVDVEFVQTSNSSAQPAAMIEIRLNRAILAVTSALFALADENAATETFTLTEERMRELLSRKKKVHLETSFAGRRRVPAGFQQSVPGYLVMFVLMNLLIFGGLAISEERNNGSLRRMATYPVSKWQIILAKVLGRFLLGFVQILYLLIVSAVFFGMDYSGNLPLVLLTMLIFAWGCAALGVMIAAVVQQSEAVQGICTLGSVVLAALGGCWWPLEIVPEQARRIGQLFPTAWAMESLHQLITFGGGFDQIRFWLMLILGFACVTTALAAKTLKIT